MRSERLNKAKRATKLEHDKKGLTVKTWMYVCKDEAELERIVNEGFVCEPSEADERNMLGKRAHTHTGSPPPLSHTHSRRPKRVRLSPSQALGRGPALRAVHARAVLLRGPRESKCGATSPASHRLHDTTSHGDIKVFFSRFRLGEPTPMNRHSYPSIADGIEMSRNLPTAEQHPTDKYKNSLVSDGMRTPSTLPPNHVNWL